MSTGTPYTSALPCTPDAFGRGDSPWRFLLVGAGAHLASIGAVVTVVMWGRRKQQTTTGRA
ncbi:hypothetical protein ACIQD5_04905 [Streptomyces microflavus]|uniref:hypothetical protein n=1 Tax=Streptomyces microflavus TaxID=1919 RepID=UPI0038306EA3